MCRSNGIPSCDTATIVHVHHVFHISLLKPYVAGGGDGLAVPEPILVDGQEEWEVERILKQRGKGSRIQFLVKYTGFD